MPRIARITPIAADLLRVGPALRLGRLLLLNTPGHMPAKLVVLPSSGIAITVKEHARGERPQAGEARVRHHDHRRVANPTHWYHDRERRSIDAAAAHARIKAP